MLIILIYVVICDFIPLEPDRVQLQLMNQTSKLNVNYDLGLDLTSDFVLTCKNSIHRLVQLDLNFPNDGSRIFQVLQDSSFHVCRLEKYGNNLVLQWMQGTQQQPIPIQFQTKYLIALTRQQGQYQLYTIRLDDLSYSLTQINFTSSNLPNKIVFQSNPAMEISNLFLYKNYTILDLNQFMMNIINTKTPQTLLFLTFEEKNQSQITKDWSRYQYVPILGNNFVYEAIDPKLNKFISGSQIVINRVNLTLQFTIEMKIQLASDISGGFTLLTMQNNKQSKLIVQLSQTKDYFINIILKANTSTGVSTKIISSIPAIIYNNILHLSIASIYLSNTQIIIQQFKNGQQSYFQNISLQIYFQNFVYDSQQIMLGSSSNNFTSYFNFLEFKLSQGYLYIDGQQFTPNCQTYFIDRCIFCQTGYVSDQGICSLQCDQSNYLQQYDQQQLKCLRICHTTCKTCITTQPQICLSCAGNRVNPPLCTCPTLFFDDYVSPDCIQYLPIQSAQIMDLTCVTSTQTCVTATYPVPFLKLPAIIMNMQSVQLSSNGEYQVWLQLFSLTGFAFCCKAPSQAQFQIRALIIETQFVTSSEGSQGSNYIVQIPQINKIIPVFLGINSGKREASLYYDGTKLTLVTPQDTSTVFWKYSINDCKNMQYYPSQYSFTAEFLQKYNLTNTQPLSASYISLVQNFSFQSSATYNQYNFYSVGSDQLYLNSQFQLTKFEFVNLYASITCSSGVCDFYDQMMSLCNNNIHKLCQCQPLGYVQTITGCLPCSKNCQTCSSPDFCTSCYPQLNQSLINGVCQCQINQFVNAQYVCQQCKYSCLTCSGSMSCSSCNPWAYRYMMSPDCICQVGYYDNGIDQMCQKCSPLCQTCNGPTTMNCTSCNSDRTIENGVCLCSKGLYEDINSICQDCLTQQGIQQPSCQYADCFDNIYTPGEQCDDGNMLPRDGCTNCMIDQGFYCINAVLKKSICAQCPPNCITCPNNKCQLCSTSYTLNRGFCIPPVVPHIITINPPVCGNFQIEKGEECDDLNILCQNCKIVQFQEKLSNNSIQAYYTTLFKNSNLTVFIPILNFNCSKITLSIDLWTLDEFNYKLALHYLSNGTQCTVALNLTKTIYTYNLIRINVNLQSSSRILDLAQQEIVIVPYQQYYISPSQTSSVQAVSSVNQGLTTSIIIAAPVAIMTGGFTIFWSMLDVLAWLNQIYFININFPDNVAVVFQQPTWQVLNVIQVPNYLNQQGDTYFTTSPDRYMQQGNDALLLNNLTSQLLLWIITFGFYFVCKIYIKVIQSYSYTQPSNIEVYDVGQIQTKKIPNTRRTSNLKFPWKQAYLYCYRFQAQIKSFTIQTLNLQYLDFLSAIVLQFQFGFHLMAYFPVMISYSMAFIGIMICIYVFALAMYTSKTHILKLKSHKFGSTYGCFVESINLENKVALMYSYINLIRKTLFIIVLVAFYYKPIIQACLCCIISFTNVALIIYQNPFESTKSFLSIGVPDICLFFLTLFCFILSLDDELLVMNSDQRFNIGWVMLTFIIISTSIQTIIMIKDSIQDIRQNVNKLLGK